MGKVTASLAISLDGVMAGPNQGPDAPMGEGAGERLVEYMHRWMFGEPEKHEAALAALQAPSAMIVGRNMFSPVAVSGTRSGVAGGATSLRTTRRCSCSRTIRASRW